MPSSTPIAWPSSTWRDVQCQVLEAVRVLPDMRTCYLAVTIVAALAYGYAALLNFAGAESVEVVAERVHVSRRWMVPFGTLLGAGAIGLLAGIAVPALGVAASIGLILYFVCALGAHLRVRDPGIGGAVFFLALAAGTLAANLTYHTH